jgi:hypothetical protein
MNILVVVEDKDDSENIFEMINALKNLKNYCIHKINLNSFFIDPWEEQTKLIIFKSFINQETFEKIKNNSTSKFIFLFKNKVENAIISLLETKNNQQWNLEILESCLVYENVKMSQETYKDKESKYSIFESKDEGIFFTFTPNFSSLESQKILFDSMEQLGLNTTLKNNELSNLYLFNNNHVMIELLKSQKIIDKNRNYKTFDSMLKFHTSTENMKFEENTSKFQNILSVNPVNQKNVPFNIETYLQHLKVKRFSKLVLYGERTISTQSFFNS